MMAPLLLRARNSTAGFHVFSLAHMSCFLQVMEWQDAHPDVACGTTTDSSGPSSALCVDFWFQPRLSHRNGNLPARRVPLKSLIGRKGEEWTTCLQVVILRQGLL